MKHNYKINIDPSLPSDEQIEKHKNFDRILADYHNLTEPIYRRPLYKNPKAFIGLVFILTLAFLVFYAVDEEDELKKDSKLTADKIEHAEESAFLNAPLEGLEIRYKTAHFSSGEKKKISLNENMTVSIPENAFIKENGEPVSGDIELKYRIFSDAAEFIAAGIPMKTGNTENAMNIMTDNVIEIRAFSDGRPLSLAEGKIIWTELNIGNDNKALPGIYFLDSTSRSWVKGGVPGEIMIRNNATSLNEALNDGMNFKPDSSSANDPFGPDSIRNIDKMFRFEFSSTGIFSVGMTNDKGKNITKLRFNDENDQPLQFFSLYKINGPSSLSYFWPVDTDFTFHVTMEAGENYTLAAITSDGKVATVSSDAITAPADASAPINVKMTLSEKKPSSVAELRKALGLALPE